MAKTKVSEWDVVADNNQDISGITLGTGMPPSYVNDSIREMMAQIKDWQSGSSGDDWTSAGTLNITGSLELDGSKGTAGQVLVSQGSSATPTWGDAFVKGMIMLWTGSVAPSGWALCDGTNDTPDLRDKFVMGSGGSQPTSGGSADAIVVSHNHTFSGSTSSAGNHSHGGVPQTGTIWYDKFNGDSGTHGNERDGGRGGNTAVAGNHAHSFSGTTNTKGSGGTNKNLPPYYALAYIMKL